MDERPEGIGGAVLIGGASRRMGRDKAAIELDGESLLSHVTNRLGPQVAMLLMVGTGSQDLEKGDLSSIPDCLPGQLGPLVGILSALEWFGTNGAGINRVYVSSVDVPFLPSDVVQRLRAKAQQNEIVFATSGGRVQYLAGLWPTSAASNIRAFLDANSGRSIKQFIDTVDFSLVEFDSQPVDPFINLNSPEDLLAAEKMLIKRGH